jgi:hypothetical protein
MHRLLGIAFAAWLIVGCGGTASSGDGGAGEGGSSTGGSGGAAVGGSGGGSVDCSLVGCAMPPLCSTGCTEPCGCCPCEEGMVNGVLVCLGGCWADGVDAGVMPGCSSGDEWYAVGASVPDPERCNTCTCEANGMVTCTTMDCVCYPANETHWRSYVGTSPGQCMTIDYVCTGNTTAFNNDCGCGCQQAASCPEWFDCMPSPGAPACDEAAIHAQCPFSAIAY